MKLKAFCGGVPLTDQNSEAPQIVQVTKNGAPVNLATVNVGQFDSANNNSLFFRFSGSDGQWIYNFRTASLASGHFVITILMPNGATYDAGLLIN